MSKVLISMHLSKNKITLRCIIKNCGNNNCITKITIFKHKIFDFGLILLVRILWLGKTPLRLPLI